jgi:hypothetical protein
MLKVEKAKAFLTGRRQAVRIPAEYRFTTDEVCVRRDPSKWRPDFVPGTRWVGRDFPPSSTKPVPK